jgi:Na+/proline symporter
MFKGIGKFAAIMLPWHFDGFRSSFGSMLSPDVAANYFSDANIYAIIILGLTSLYVIKGGMVSVVITEVMQFMILTITALVIGCIAIYKVSPDMIQNAIPAGWANPFFGWKLDLNWTGILDKANDAIKSDGNEWFGIIFGLMFFKGILASLAGPAPNYDMQRILATRNPREAGMMNGMVNVVLMFPRYMMIAGITILALAFCMTELRGMDKPDFEQIMPIVLRDYVPVGVLGFLLAGLMAAMMSNFAATLNAAPAYLVNDIYKRYINPHSTGKTEVRLSRIVSLVFLVIGIGFGVLTMSITEVLNWLVGGLYGGYVLANVLKWYWWRFNGYGYFWGMMTGILSAMFIPESPIFGGFAKMYLGHPVSNTLYLFPIILGASVVGCILGTLLTKPEDDAILKHFYKTVNPWGFWGPIREKVMRDDPTFRPNKDFSKDCINVAVGIVWQLCLVSLPIYIVLRNWHWAGAIFAILVVTSIFIKFNWYDKLEKA